MNQEQEKKNNLKIYITFALVLAGSFFVGMLCGMGAKIFQRMLTNQEQLWNNVKHAAVYVMPVVFAGYNAVFFIVSMSIYRKNKRLAERWDGEDEDVIDNIEHQLSFPMLFSNICIILNYLFFVLLIELAEFTGLEKSASAALYALNVGIFMVGFVLYIVVIKLEVDLEKKLNPEKQGNVFDMKFTKRWTESCDEAEKQLIGQCAYKAFGAGNTACMVLWIITVLSEFALHTGVLPTMCVCAIWLVQNVVYMRTAMKLDRKHVSVRNM